VAQVRALVEIPSGGASDSTVILGLATTGTSTATTSSELWEVRYKTGGALNVRGWSRGSLIVDSTIAFAIDGRRGILGLLLTQNGANIDWRVDFLGDDRAGVTQYSAATVASYTFGRSPGCRSTPTAATPGSCSGTWRSTGPPCRSSPTLTS
jgi:hypothetical protein